MVVSSPGRSESDLETRADTGRSSEAPHHHALQQAALGAALQLIDQGLGEIQLPEHRRDLEDLKRLCLAYQAWDWFDHHQAHEYFQEIDRGLIQRWSEKIAQNKGWVAQIAQADYSEKLLIDLCSTRSGAWKRAIGWTLWLGSIV
jgi:hypothetical protein